MKRPSFFPAVLVVVIIGGCATGRDVIDSGPSGVDGARAYASIITPAAITDEGLFAVHRVASNIYFEIPDSLLGRDLLLVSRIAQAPANLGPSTAGGTKVGEQVVQWQRSGDRVLLRRRSYASVASDSLPISRSVRVSNFEPILMAFDIEIEHPETGAAVIRVNDLFETDVRAISGLSTWSRSEFKVSRLDKDRTFTDAVDSFPANVNVRHTLTFEASAPPSDADTGTISMQMFQSMILLPDKPMRQRVADSRVGYFSVRQVDYGSDELAADTRQYISRWRLEPSDSIAYARGEVVDPVRPITFYVDPATPERWRPYVRAGVQDWQPVFESAGFRNAIVAKDPSTLPEFDPEDVRFSTIRYAASTRRNAKGPRVTDPRSGEIIESDIFWYHNHLRSYRNRLMIETGAANPAARTLVQPDELIGEALRQVIAHEVGHALGLQHNMAASSAFPVDSLRSPSFTNRYGVAPSIMDYARQNYVAQPGDGVTRFIRKIGPYDHYAIEWGYRLLPGATAEQERSVLNGWIRERAGNPWYRFGPNRGGDRADPRSQTEDIGSDPLTASTLAVANLKRVLPRLISWTARPGLGYEDLAEIYSELLAIWSTYMRHVQSVVGGVYETRKTADQPGPVYEIVPRVKQEEAVRFLVEEVFVSPAWLQENQILDRIGGAGGFERISDRQTYLLNGLLSDARLRRISDAEVTHPLRSYRLADLMRDIRDGLWSEIGTRRPSIDPFRRKLQRAHIRRLGELVRSGTAIESSPSDDRTSTTDLPSLAREQLTVLRREALRAAGRAEDNQTRVHLEDVVARIDALLRAD